jgi:hypothetical protein
MKTEDYFLKNNIVPLIEVALESNNNSAVIYPQPVAATRILQGHGRQGSCNQLLMSSSKNPKKRNSQNQDFIILNENKITQDDNVNKENLDSNRLQSNEALKDSIIQTHNINDNEMNENIIVNNYIENADQLNSSSNFKNSQITENRIIITLKDYKSLTMKESIIYDKRLFKTYFFDKLIECHRILNLIFVVSIFKPRYIRINETIFDFSLNFSIGAFLFVDSYIDARANSPQKV